MPQRSGAGLGAGIEAVGEGLDTIARSEAANFALKTTAAAEQNWHEELLKRQQTAEPGAPNFTPDLLKDYDKYAKAATKNAPNGLAANLLQKQLVQLRSTVAQRAINFESGEAVRHNAEVAVDSISTAGNEVMNDPSVYAQRLADRQALIAHMNLEPGQREKLQQHAKDELSKFATMGAIERDPYASMIDIANVRKTPTAKGQVEAGTISNIFDRPILKNSDGSYSTTSSMSFGTDKGEVLVPTVVDGKRLTEQQAKERYYKTGEHLGIFDTPEHADEYAESLHNAQARHIETGLPYIKDLSPEARVQLMNHADQVLRSRVADATRLDSMAEKQNEKQRQDVLMQGVLAAKQGQLTPDWITQHAPLLKAEDVDHLYRELAGGENVKSDLHTYSDLLTRAVSGEDVTTQATAAYTRGLLGHEDYTRLVTTSGKEIPTPFKAGSSYIRQALDTQMNPDPDRNKSLADALTEWNDWFEKNPQVTREDAEKKAESISTRYRLFGAQSQLFTLKPPMYLQGSRAQPDLDATEKATFDGLKNSEIDQAEFNKQAALLAQWRAAAEIAAKKKAAADKASAENQ